LSASTRRSELPYVQQSRSERALPGLTTVRDLVRKAEDASVWGGSAGYADAVLAVETVVV
jgi:hypothetical protein